MLQAARLTTMDSSSSLALPRSDYGGAKSESESASSGDAHVSPTAEGRARKRFQRTTSENEDPLRKPGLFSRSNNVTQASSDPKMNPAGHNRRRSTLRDNNNRPLLGPRPLESKRITSESHAAPANRPSFLPTSTSENILANPHSNSNSRFSYSGQQPRDPLGYRIESFGSTDFLPSVNFDDFHAKITGYEADLDNFPVPGHNTRAELESPTRSDMGDNGRGPTAVVPAGNGMGFGAGRGQDPTEKVSRSSSLARRFSNARRNPAQNPAADSTAMPPPSAPLANRGRRQSALPTGPPVNIPAAVRQPRKSVGPGLLTQGFEERKAVREAQPSSGSLSRNTSINKPNPRAMATPSSATVAEGPRLATAARTTRTKSLQPPSRNTSQGLLNPNATTPINANSPSFPGASPGRTPTQRGPTPSSGSGNKRQSQMHHGGLGARTISPTDARRLKRLSIAPPRPPIPQAPLTPQPDAVANLHANMHSPVVPHRKNDTPSSARGTPDFARKSGISGVGSLSSSSSFSSLRQPNGGSTSRNSQLGSSSRLPTPKSRNVHSSAGGAEEEVPPVPAIPKAYESPKDLLSNEPAQYFVPRRPSRVDSDEFTPGRASRGTSVSRAQTGSKLTSRPSIDGPRSSLMPPPKTAPPPAPNSRHRRGLTVGTGEHEKPQPTQRNKRNLQPLTLPPLNLLPLSTPTSNRIASFPAPSLEVDDRHATPPPKRNFAKTPSTPMTASKALFFSRSNRDNDDDHQPFNLRAASSHMMGLEGFGRNMSPTTPLAIPSPAPRHGQPTPFSSNSLPKGNGDFGHLLHTPIDEYSYDHRVDNSMVNAHLPSPKPPIAAKREEASTRTSTSDEPSTPASSTSLRRKLSLGWKRTSSKASRRDKADAEKADRIEREREKDEAKRASKQKEMPPPKFPASATWSGISPPTQEPTSRLSFESRFRKSSSNFANSQNGNSQTNNATAAQQDAADLSVFMNHFPSKEDIQEPLSTQEHHRRVASRSTSSSLLTPMQRMLGQKNSLGALKARHLDTNLDKDDLAADKIMEKMGSKRKDFEQAARDIDDLRRRAHPREKCAPAQASQMYPLNIFEKGEIVDYKEIYFCGTQKARKHVGDLDHSTNNFGYDDDRGDYNIVMGDHLSYRYEVVDMLGKGSFGQVVRCIDHKTGLLVAVKIIRNKKRFHQQALIEVNILQKLREWDPDNKHSMINFIQSFYFRGHLCISTELLGMNLYEFIKAYEFKGFPLPLIRRFSRQMLSSLVMLKSKRVIHCDLKPENILLAHPMHSEIKVIDFGSSCFENEKVYTYIQSRFYRSPEVILGMSYGIPIDMWSLGCILAELLTGYPIFPGENEQEQLACIMEIFGPPEKHLIEKSSRKKLFFDSMGKPRVTVSTKGRRRRPSSKTLQQALKCDDEAFLDFISRCLRWDPERRLKPDEAMQHEFVTGLKRQPVSRARMMQGNGSTQTPAKRFPIQTPQRKVTQEGSRPLPEPPAMTMRHASVGPPPSSSPIKGPGRRHSTFSAGQNGIVGPRTAAQRTVTAGSGIGTSTVIGSNLPRAAPGAGRSVSGRPDMASAAASASLRRPPPS
ncbi:Transcriptional activator protein [Venturia nashicola]|nr:Transcriptional activator protein [Venturia nashicola]